MGIKLIIKDADFSANGMAGEIYEPLPNGYRRLPYLEVDGNNYINTGYKYTGGDFRLEVKAEFTELRNNTFICGAQSAQGARSLCVGYYGETDDGTYFAEGNARIYDGILLCGKTDTLVDIDLTSSNNGMTVGGTSAGNEVRSMTFQGSTNPNLNLLVFGKYGGTGIEALMTGRLYKFRLTVSGELIMDLAPCTNSEGTMGVYDRARQVFMPLTLNI